MKPTPSLHALLWVQWCIWNCEPRALEMASFCTRKDSGNFWFTSNLSFQLVLLVAAGLSSRLEWEIKLWQHYLPGSTWNLGFELEQKFTPAQQKWKIKSRDVLLELSNFFVRWKPWKIRESHSIFRSVIYYFRSSFCGASFGGGGKIFSSFQCHSSIMSHSVTKRRQMWVSTLEQVK